MTAKLTTMVYLFHLLYILSSLHKLLKRGGVMKPNESAKKHPVSFVGNQIRGDT